MVDAYLDFIEKINRKIGLDLSQYKRPQMERRITSLMKSCDCHNFNEYFVLLEKDKNQLNRFINHLTINVSEFYRNPAQWQVLQEKILPELLSKSPNLKIWSAGCSTGDEPYTVAMILSEIAPRGNHQIIAADLDQEVLRKAQEGIYHIKSVAGLPPQYVNKYFTRDGDAVQIVDTLKKMIKFKAHNLLKDPFESNVDLLICRNVVIYFTEEAKTALYRKFHQALKPHGILFIGSTEQIFQPQEIGFKSAAMFFYQKI
ncbi:MAG: protein-glutamate O-methyltransferase CheR [Clostridia bacterium]|nr:protein-glutamate O-methyltransferase CheR [Clostridia bacterium]